MSKSFRQHPLYPRVEAEYLSNLNPAAVAAADLTWDEFVDAVADGARITRATVTSLMVAPRLTDTVREHYPHLVSGQQDIKKFLRIWQHGKFHPRFARYYDMLYQGTNRTSSFGTESETVAAACYHFAELNTPYQYIDGARKQGFSWSEIVEGATAGIALEYLSELRAA